MEKNENNKSTEPVFECSICLETAKEPIVTKCGHIYCWPCIYNWMEAKGKNSKCPNCKNPISKNDLIPLYTKDENSQNTKRFENIPKRPKAERNNENNENDNTNFGNNFFFNFGFMPLFGLNMNIGNFNFFGGNLFNNNNRNNNNSFNNFMERLPENTKNAVHNLIILFFMIILYFWFNNLFS